VKEVKMEERTEAEEGYWNEEEGGEEEGLGEERVRKAGFWRRFRRGVVRRMEVLRGRGDGIERD